MKNKKRLKQIDKMILSFYVLQLVSMPIKYIMLSIKYLIEYKDFETSLHKLIQLPKDYINLLKALYNVSKHFVNVLMNRSNQHCGYMIWNSVAQRRVQFAYSLNGLYKVITPFQRYSLEQSMQKRLGEWPNLIINVLELEC